MSAKTGSGHAVRSLRGLGLLIATAALAACAQVGPATAPQDEASTHLGASLSPTQIASLGNLSKGQVLARLGQPDFTRRDPPAEIWQYRSVGCVLDLFLYPEGSGDLRVAHAESRDRRSARAPADSCTPFTAPSQTAANS